MQSQHRMSWGLMALLATGLAGLSAPPLSAQGFGGGGGQMPPEIQAKMKAWQKWRENHKSLASLQTMIFQLRELDKDPGGQLTKPQASKILTVLKSWRHKPTMSD